MTICTVAGCGARVVARGLCGKHYQRNRKHGDPEQTLTPGRGVVIECSVAGCAAQASCRGWCRTHYSRWVSTGDPEGLKRAANGSGWMSHGYRVLPVAGHPLSTALGRVLEHRMVLYDAIGPGWHPCHWCSKPVTWGFARNSREIELVSDHLDGNKLNNVPANLVPSCWLCNARRAQPA